MISNPKSKFSNPVRVLALALLTAQSLGAQSIDTMALRAHTRFLASDLLEGRGTGTRGEHLAALYIASQLDRMGARPVGKDFLLPVPLKRAIIDNAATTVSLRDTTYQSVRDFVWNTGGRASFRDFAGPMVFVDLRDSTVVRRAAETRGHVVIVAGGMGATAQELVPAMIKAGAVGVVILITDANQYGLYVRSRGDSRYYADADVNDPVWQADLPVIIAGPALARSILAGSIPQNFGPLPGSISARFKATVRDVTAANVAGVIPGSDAKLASQYVVFTAHYDHLGISTPDERGDSIYNGFSDNAAGVAMVLGVADVLKREKSKRSVLMLFFTGEERGLLGSSYFAAHAPIQLGQIKGLINLDAGAPSGRPVEWRIAGGNATPLGEITRKALSARGWKADLGNASPNSDYWPFLARGVPAVFIIPGNRWEGLTDAEQKALRVRWDHYHKASDEWAFDFPFSGMARYAEAALAVARTLAN